MSLRARINSPEERTGRGEDGHLVASFRAKLLEEIDLAEMSALSPAERRARLERVLGHIISREGPVLSTVERSQLIRRVVDEALGLGILEPLLEDPSVTEIMVNGPDAVFVERGGRVEQLPLRFASHDQLMQTIERIVSTVNRRVDESNPMVDARLPSGERVNVIIPPLSLTGAVLTIRRFPRSFTLQELIGLGSLDEPMLYLLAGLVQARFNIIVSGATGTGKTTLLNALSGLIPEGERIITIEDSAELQLQQPHVIRLESRPPNVEGKGRVTIRDLVRNSSGCVPTASSSARSAAASPWTCSRRCPPATTAPSPPSTPTAPRTPSPGCRPSPPCPTWRFPSSPCTTRSTAPST